MKLSHFSRFAGSFLALFAAQLSQAEAAFVENMGQWDAGVRFKASSPGVDVWVTERGAVLDIHKVRSIEKGGLEAIVAGIGGGSSSRRLGRRGHVLRMEFVGSLPAAVQGVGKQDAVTNYIVGNNPNDWVNRVPQYDEARSQRIYEGTQVRWYWQGGLPRYDLILAPGADPSQIGLRIDGASRVSTDGRTLSIATSVGEVRQQDLVAYQEGNGGRRIIPCSMKVRGNVLRFDVGKYDRTKPLIIDPLVWSSFIGGSQQEFALTSCPDSQGNLLIAGFTYSPQFPVTPGAYNIIQPAVAGFVTKFQDNGSNLVWSTFITVPDGEAVINDIALGPNQEVWLTGSTASRFFPTTANAFMRSYRASADAFVSCLSADGSQLLASTYLGAASSDKGIAIAVDSLGRPVVSGTTTSANFPTTAGSYDVSRSGPADGFVCRLSADCTTLLGSTLLGGSNDIPDISFGESVLDLAIDSLGRIVVVGSTDATDFPVTPGVLRSSGAWSEVFVARLSSGLRALVSSTLLGGSGGEIPYKMALNASDQTVIVGFTVSTDFPVSLGAYRTQLPQYGGGFISTINAAGSQLLQSTYWLDDSQLYGIAVNANGEIAVCGRTLSNSFPLTFDGFTTADSGGYRATVSVLNPSGSTLLYSSSFGGAVDDRALLLAFANDQSLFVTGDTYSDDFPTTVGAFDRSNGGNMDTFVMKLIIPKATTLALSKPSVVGGFGLEGTVTIDRPAPPGGALVKLDSSPIISLPATVRIGAGAVSKSFKIGTSGVTSKSVVRVDASAGGKTVSQSLTLTVGGLVGMSVNPTSVVPGQASVCTVTLSGVAPTAGRTVLLSSNRPYASVPASVTIPAGASSATFPITTTAGLGIGTAQITASLGTAQLVRDLLVIPGS